MTEYIYHPLVILVAETGSVNMEWIMKTDNDSSCLEDVLEFAGRSCYESFNKPNPATAKNKDYLANIIEQGHESVLEHGSVTFYITGVSRSCTHELVRLLVE